MPEQISRDPKLVRFAWSVLGLNVLVILWGAFVRASGSGAGCGSHWPTCDGAVVPRPETAEMWIEFTHRLTSGLALIGVLVLFIWVYRRFPKGHQARKGALFSLAFILLEALIGAGLVLFELVAFNVSVARAVVIAVHLINTFFLLAALTLTAWWVGGGSPWVGPRRARLAWVFGVAGVALLVLGASGAITALGDTLVLRAGIEPATSPVLAALVGLRLYHPALAIGVGLLLWAAFHVAQGDAAEPALARRTGHLLLGVYGLQFLAGLLNVYLKAPIWLQLLHLLLADTLWICFVLLAVQSFGRPQTHSASVSSIPTSTSSAPYSQGTV